MGGRGEGRGTVASRWALALLAAAMVSLVTAAPAAARFVQVDAKLERIPGGAVVTGQIEWNRGAAIGHFHMSVGDLRLLAISKRGHLPTLLATHTYPIVDPNTQQLHRTEQVHLVINRDDLRAIRKGNRVVLTASQHSPVGGTLTNQTYVTVGEIQPFGIPQGRIGHVDCSGVPIAPGEVLRYCDLVGAFLDGALISHPQKGGATRMEAADLTGATMKGANLTELSVAGGRLNGADMTNATIQKLSLAGAKATGLIARGVQSPVEKEGTNLFDAQLTRANFSGAVLKGVSLNHARLDGANLEGVTWDGRDANTASFRGALLSGSTGKFPTVYFADLTRADLSGAPALDPKNVDLSWATLCGTVMPTGSNPPISVRDCRAKVDPGPAPPANEPYVKIDSAGLVRHKDEAEIRATIHWNVKGRDSYRMSAGDVRAVAIDRLTGVPTALGQPLSIPNAETKSLPAETRYATAISNHDELAAMRPGNRVVLTATQHPPPPSDGLTHRSYVTVYTLKPGPGRGRVGSRNCSDMLLTAPAPKDTGYDFCDLPGAVLTKAELGGPMLDADLTGADLRGAGLSNIKFDGSAMGGAVATGARFNDVSMVEAFAPRFTMEGRLSLIKNAELRAKNLDRANFNGTTISETHFTAAPLRAANFSGATFKHVDLAYARLRRAKLDHVIAKKEPQGTSLFLADLTGATLAGNDSDWADDEMGNRPWFWATLCHTTMPTGADISGDRDCPRLP